MQSIILLKSLRLSLLNLVEDLTSEQLLKIPTNFNNNILWNLAHLVATQQILHYKLSNLDVLINETLVNENKKGSSPASWTLTPDILEIKNLLVELPNKLEKDYKMGIFQNFKSYKTSMGFELNNIEDSIEFNNAHEGIHIGSIIALKNLV